MSGSQVASTDAVSTARGSWRDRFADLRNGLLMRPGFQRWAAAFPLTRPIAQRRARALFDLVAGFVYSQVLLACVQLRLFDILAEAPQSVGALAVRCRLDMSAMERLLAAAISLELVERRRDGRYGLGAVGAPMAGNAALVAMVEHHAALYADLADPVALLRGEATGAHLAAYWPYAAGRATPACGDSVVRAMPADKVAKYSALMSASQPLVADDILDAYPLTRHRCLMDVGGGEGVFLRAVARRAPHIALMLFDLPPVAERARQQLTESGLAGRTQVVGGDFYQEALPRGADVMTLVRIVHDHDDDGALRILTAIYDALPVGGTLLVAEPMSETPGAEPMGDAYFGFYLMAMGRGRPRTAAHLTALLKQAGFGAVRTARTHRPLQTGLLVATRRS